MQSWLYRATNPTESDSFLLLTLHDPISITAKQNYHMKKGFLLCDQSEEEQHFWRPIRRFCLCRVMYIVQPSGRSSAYSGELGLNAVQCTTNRTGPFTI